MNNRNSRNNGDNNRTAVLGQYFVNCCSKLLAAGTVEREGFVDGKCS
jgi:hypothetical protein